LFVIIDVSEKIHMLNFVCQFDSKDDARERACELRALPLTFNSKAWRGHAPRTIECCGLTYDGDRTITIDFRQANLPGVELEDGRIVPLNLCAMNGVPVFAVADFNEFDFGRLVQA
jgi:hypothetical protein